jgi:serine/threonine protein kinase
MESIANFDIGDIISSYRIMSKKHGGMSTVYICEPIRNAKISIDESVAIKVPNVDIDLLNHEEYTDMMTTFYEESKINSMLSKHPSFITVLFSNVKNSIPYLVMQLAHDKIKIGASLKNLSLPSSAW